jgi:hypothetical protein
MIRKLTRWLGWLPDLVSGVPWGDRLPSDPKSGEMPWLWLQTPGLGVWRMGIS